MCDNHLSDRRFQSPTIISKSLKSKYSETLDEVYCSMFKGSSGCRINYLIDSSRQRISYAGSCNWLDVQLSTATFFFTVIFATVLILMVILGTG